jgi:hypothetical protein
MAPNGMFVYWTVTPCACKDCERLRKVIHSSEQEHAADPVLEPKVRLLQTAEQALKVDASLRKDWFAKVGPDYQDFRAGRVYPRTDSLEKLKALVHKPGLSMLVGENATGKTVLVRHLLYDRYDKGLRNTFWFSDLDFDVSSLAAEINSISGLIIIENVHLQTPQYQRLLERLVTQPTFHVLFTAHPSFRDNQNRKLRLLEVLPQMPLDAKLDIDAVLDHYARKRFKLELSPDQRASIISESDDDLWLLRYALEGYDESRGSDPSSDWVARGVREDLRDLGKKRPIYPAVLVALAPLYLNEVVTAESFLLDILGFDDDTLEELVALGEIRRYETLDGDTFYGLTHAAVAKAYWEHGVRYRRRGHLPGYADFLYQYAVAGAGNAFVAVSRADHDARFALLNRLVSEGHVERMVANAHVASFRVAMRWISPEVPDDEEDTRRMARAVAKRMAELGERYPSVWSCAELFWWRSPVAVREFVNEVTPEQMAKAVCNNDYIWGNICVLCALAHVAPNYYRAVWSKVDKRMILLKGMSQPRWDLIGTLHALSKDLPEAWPDVRPFLTEDLLRQCLSAQPDIIAKLALLHAVFEADQDISAREWCVDDVAAALIRVDLATALEYSLKDMDRRDPVLVSHLCERVDIGRLEEAARGRPDEHEWMQVLEWIRAKRGQAARPQSE